MPDTNDKPNSDSNGGTAILRFVLLLILLGAVLGAIEGIFHTDDLKAKIQQSGLYLSLTCIAMTAIAVLLARFGGMGLGIEMEAGWKKQVLGIVSFWWSMATASMIGRLLFFLLPIESKNYGVMLLVIFSYFFIGCIIVLPFQYFAFRPYAKRHNIPIWPNLPKE
jgi:hypothetical protein